MLYVIEADCDFYVKNSVIYINIYIYIGLSKTIINWFVRQSLLHWSIYSLNYVNETWNNTYHHSYPEMAQFLEILPDNPEIPMINMSTCHMKIYK